jgi:hypothetical protein
LTINKLLEKTREEMGNREYFSYDAFSNNCQKYIKTILEVNGMYNNNINTFLYQDVTPLKNDLPSFVPNVANTITTAIGLLNEN